MRGNKIEYNIYILHARKGYEVQEAHSTALFRKHKLPFMFITERDPEDFNEALLKRYFLSHINNKLSKGSQSLVLKHFLAYEKFLETKLPYAIIFEDDPFFLGDFKKQLSKIIDELLLLKQGVFVSLENTSLDFPSFFQTKKNKYLYRASSGRMAGAYLIDREAAKRIIDDLNNGKCDNAIDWWHNDLVNRNIIKMYWAHPPLTEQGSHNGLMSSTVSTQEKSLQRRVRWLIQKAYKMFFRRLFIQQKILE